MYAFTCLVDLSTGRIQVLPFGHHDVQVHSGSSCHYLDAAEASYDYIDVSAACGVQTRSSAGIVDDGFG